MPATIVLIHGLIGHLNEPRIANAISGGRVVAPDLLGYGEHAGIDMEGVSLQDQADHVAAFIRRLPDGPAHLAGHSVGGAVAVLLAHSHPELVASVTSVEGNFTLRDAFWSGKLAQMDLTDIRAIFANYRADPDTWLATVDVPPNAWTRSVARRWLEHQPASTIRAQSRAVIQATAVPTYLDSVRGLLASELPFHLIAGERSQSGWDVPEWVRSGAATSTVIPATGHMMMLEDPEGFGAVLTKLHG